LPGGSFVNPGTALRDELTKEAVNQVLRNTSLDDNYLPIGEIIDERAIVNGIIGLLATGGSTNHTIHLVAIAAAAGIQIDWSDFAELSHAVPLLAHVYPNGMADVNHFHAAGGLGFVIRELLSSGILHQDVSTILGPGLDRFCVEPTLDKGKLGWKPAVSESLDTEIVRPVANAFDKEGGLRLVQGNIGRAIAKVSAVSENHQSITAKAIVFESQDALTNAFQDGELERDFVAVLPFQGARAVGMPELHKLTPYLGVLQNRGHKVALLTDGRMSGASGKVLAAIQVSPEAADGGLIAKIRTGDLVSIDTANGLLQVESDDGSIDSRSLQHPDLSANRNGMGRELFTAFRQQVSSAESGGTIFPPPG
jgi:phosphogluconate dehydratase